MSPETERCIGLYGMHNIIVIILDLLTSTGQVFSCIIHVAHSINSHCCLQLRYSRIIHAFRWLLLCRCCSFQNDYRSPLLHTSYSCLVLLSALINPYSHNVTLSLSPHTGCGEYALIGLIISSSRFTFINGYDFSDIRLTFSTRLCISPFRMIPTETYVVYALIVLLYSALSTSM